MSYPNSATLALRDLSFSIHSGEFVFVIGQSGSGKTTIVKLLTCEEKILKGNIFVGKYRLNKMKRRLVPYLRRNIGMVFQDFRLIPTKTIFENVAFAMEILGYSRKAIRLQVSMVLSTVGLRAREDAYPNELSGGEQQRVAIARAMVNNPAILLADEPTGNLDPANSEMIMALLEEINRGGTTVVICTHNRELVNRMKKRVIEIDDGSLVRDDESSVYGDDTPRYTPRELKRRRGAAGEERGADEDSLDDEEFEIPEFARGIFHMDDYMFDQDDYPEDSEENEVSDAPDMPENVDVQLEEPGEQETSVMSDELALAELSRAGEEYGADEDSLDEEEFEIPEFARDNLQMDDYILDKEGYPEDSEEDEVSDAPDMPEQVEGAEGREVSAYETADYNVDVPLEEPGEQEAIVISDELTLTELSRAVEDREEDDLREAGSEDGDHDRFNKRKKSSSDYFK
jgi:cell division ATP-binding protein FtsE